MVASGEAVLYQEPERSVTTRSGDQCVVALTNQWYLDYGEPGWKETVRNVLKGVRTYAEEVNNNFLTTLDWLHEHACSRVFGLGTLIPWDPKFMIESLSDSTIYMSYYTVAYLLQGGVVNGSTPGPLGIRPEQMTVAVWDYVFFGGDLPTTDIPPESLRFEIHIYAELFDTFGSKQGSCVESSATGTRWTCGCRARTSSRTTSPTSCTTTRPSGRSPAERELGRSHVAGPKPSDISSSTLRRSPLYSSLCVCVSHYGVVQLSKCTV
ncbi:Leucine--tRNA ligase, cytoplasmic [Geodia barretti]|uniref:Leucine--tRNA ligase, cytoplasmic n=1 Tax=Geodia barretti TaxID=519541 RepID=A0AA35TLR3_GEOBA|nr:Leucine--tRNA ligase, cytoplasmic [Geodia barretti]